MRWSVGVEAQGDRVLTREEVVELADAVAASSGSRARARMLLIAPSLMESENSSSSSVASRSMLMA